ncbi:MAG: hypothetical protein ACR2G3_12580 [Solirubrobacterales bacterium]
MTGLRASALAGLAVLALGIAIFVLVGSSSGPDGSQSAQAAADEGRLDALRREGLTSILAGMRANDAPATAVEGVQRQLDALEN